MAGGSQQLRCCTTDPLVVATLSQGYNIKFRCRLPVFRGIRLTTVSDPKKSQLGDTHPPGEGGNRSCRSSNTARWVLLTLFFNSKERGWVSPYTGLMKAEHISISAGLPHVEDSRRVPGCDSAKPVHIHSQSCQELSSIQSKGWVPQHVPGHHPASGLSGSKAGRGHTPPFTSISNGQEGEIQPCSQVVGDADISDKIVPLGLFHVRPFQIWTGGSPPW